MPKGSPIATTILGKTLSMADITFRGKIETISNMDGTKAYDRIKVPKIERRHCDMAAFRSHPKYGAYANSDLFKNLISKQLRDRNIGTHIRLDKLPECVAIDTSGFLAEVTISL